MLNKMEIDEQCEHLITNNIISFNVHPMAMAQFNWRDDTLIEFSILSSAYKLCDPISADKCPPLYYSTTEFVISIRSAIVELSKTNTNTSAAHFMTDKTGGNRCT